MTATDLEPVTGSRHTEEQIERGLYCFALEQNQTRAAKLAGVSRQTIRNWVARYPVRYARVREQLIPQIQERVAQEAEDLMRSLVRVERKAVTKIEGQLEDPRWTGDPSTVLRNVSTSKALQNDKIVGPNRGRPAAIIEHRSTEAFVKAHRQFVVDAECVELPAGEVELSPK